MIKNQHTFHIEHDYFKTAEGLTGQKLELNFIEYPYKKEVRYKIKKNVIEGTRSITKVLFLFTLKYFTRYSGQPRRARYWDLKVKQYENT